MVGPSITFRIPYDYKSKQIGIHVVIPVKHQAVRSTTLKKIGFVFLVFWLLSSSLGMASQTSTGFPNTPSKPYIGESCTIFTVTAGNRVFFGNNEDYRLWGIYAWFVPSQTVRIFTSDETVYGAIFFGFDENGDRADGYPQGGMNDQGLCVDGNGLGPYSINPHPERQPPSCSLMAQVLWECATVDEVEAWFLTHTIGSSMNYQLHYADANGEAVVVSAGPDNEIAFTRIGSSSCLVSTNINVADTSLDVYDCWRYSTSMSMLSGLTTENELTAEACRDVLNAVHQDGTYATKYSNVFDCVNLDVFLWYDRDFSNVASFNLETELAAVQPGVTGYQENDPLFGAYTLDGDIFYRRVPITDLFEGGVLVPPVHILLIAVGLVAVVLTVSGVLLFRRKRTIS